MPATTHRNAHRALQQRQRTIERRAKSTSALEFFNVLSSAQFLDTTEALWPHHRQRLYPPTVALSMFMRQVLQADGSCQEAVNSWAAQRAATGLSACSVRTGGYCRARQRLPLEAISTLARRAGQCLHHKALAPWLWRARTVKLVEGTGLSMPDTKENQARYPQPSSQALGVGFPMARLVLVTCLATGAVLEAAIGPLGGKGSGELSLVRPLLARFSAGDIVLADALYCNYFLIAALMAAGVDVLMEQNGSRITNFECGQSLGAHDHVVRWPKPPKRPPWMTPEQYAQAPHEIVLREVKVAHRVLVSTLVNHRQSSKEDLSQLYARRWNIELDLRSLKTTCAMDVLRCQTPEMNEKQLWVHLLAYNVIRLLMAQAASYAGVEPRSLSFKHTVQLWTQWSARGLSVQGEEHRLLALIAQCKVGHRPGRIEPRMRKRRPKPYPWLKVPRDEARRDVALHGHERRAK
ncbi:IS4 family transposase [Simplicispira psychrophila]|uniref:IS4 family transposase n=1 Tax=Simplicispira psychrophila TaxID=80882 RepID=UPI0005678D62|nr:IS4 family transposase [Simplicispira psychrophila]